MNTLYSLPTPKRTLSIAPNSRYLGIAVLENKKPIFFITHTIKIKHFPQNRIEETKKATQELIDLFHPQILAVRHPCDHWIKQSHTLIKIVNAIIKTGKINQLEIKELTIKEIKKTVCGSVYANKFLLFDKLLSLYPDLKSCIEHDNIKNSYWKYLFDALLIGMIINKDDFCE